MNTLQDNASVVVYNESGKTIREIIVNKTSDWLVLPLTGIPAGNFIAVLKNGSVPLKTAKFVIVR